MSLLYRVERLCKAVRHSALLKKAAPLWSLVRPLYDRFVGMAGKDGVVRNINGTDLIRLSPECRGTGEVYEPQVWALVMKHMRDGARAIDVGAHVGLYATALGLRAGCTGRVLAVEPDPENLVRLRDHIRLNKLEGIVEIAPVAVTDRVGEASLTLDSLQSHVSETGSVKIKTDTLDRIAGEGAWDLMLIDVEGFEEVVLRGGPSLLGDAKRKPSVIVIEVHPYAWEAVGTTSSSLLDRLTSAGYRVVDLEGRPVTAIRDYGHIVAMRD